MVYDPSSPLGVEGPTAADLAAIESEWPLIAAEMDLVTAEIHMLTVARPSDLDWRRLRRAEARVLREAAALTGPAAPEHRRAA